jgi:hypothetical protein
LLFKLRHAKISLPAPAFWRTERLLTGGDEVDKFDQYSIEIMKSLLLINGGAFVVLATAIGYNATNDKLAQQLALVFECITTLLWLFGGGVFSAAVLGGLSLSAAFIYEANPFNAQPVKGSKGFESARGFAVLFGLISVVCFCAGTLTVICALRTSVSG